MVNNVSVLVDIEYIIFSLDELSDGYCSFLSQFYSFFLFLKEAENDSSIELWTMKMKNGSEIPVELQQNLGVNDTILNINAHIKTLKRFSLHLNCFDFLSLPCALVFTWIVGQTESRRWNIF